MTIKEWFADNVEQIVQIAHTFDTVIYCKRNSAKMNIQIRLKSGSKISLESYKIPKNKEFGFDVFLLREGDLYPTFIYRTGPSIGQVTTGIELAIMKDSPMGQQTYGTFLYNYGLPSLCKQKSFFLEIRPLSEKKFIRAPRQQYIEKIFVEKRIAL